MALLTVEEAADLLRVKVSWLYERTRTNEVPHLKLGKYLRFDEEELWAWARQSRRGGRGPAQSRTGAMPGRRADARENGPTVGLKAHRS
jgi:excisionase family DNA binding protein